MRAGVIALAMLAMTEAAAAEMVQLYAAGSLKAALSEVAKAFEAKTGNKVEAKYGASGLLMDDIAGGAKADAGGMRLVFMATINVPPLSDSQESM